MKYGEETTEQAFKKNMALIPLDLGFYRARESLGDLAMLPAAVS